MRLLLINANTTAAMTDTLVTAARRIVANEVTVTGATARFGARYIATRSAYAIAAHATLDVYAERGRDADAVVIACFGDPGLLALRELAQAPVIGMAEASCREAARRGRFAIVTGGVGWITMLEEFVAQIGLSDLLCVVRAVTATGGEIAADPKRFERILAQECRAAATQDGAEVVILGGAGLIGIAERIASDVPVPVIDCLAAAIRTAEDTWAVPGWMQEPGARPVETTGLSDRLAELLSRRSGHEKRA